MRERLRVFIALAIFWIGFMVVARVWFMAYNHDYSAQLLWNEMALAMIHGLRMDASISGYFLALSGLLLTTSVFIKGKWISTALTTITLLLLLLASLIVMVDFELYRHWGFRMNTTPLFYLGSEAIGSIEASVVIKLICILLVLYGAFTWLYFRYIEPRTKSLPEVRPKASLVLLLVTGLLFFPIRGSFSVAPMNSGFVYFHNSKPFANHSAVNVVWNFLYSVRKSASLTYPENFFDKNETQKLFSSLYPQSDSTTQLLNTRKPNILLIILESFTADVVEPLGGMKNITPNLNQLCQEGILFDSIYSSGDRTDKGLIATLSGYPAQTQTSIIKFPSKTQRLPHLNRHLKKLGYKSSFTYGGDVDFANFRSYLNNGGFDQLTTVDDFDDTLDDSKWGVHDHFVFEKALQELDTTSEKFFKVILTLSSHEPFDVPMIPQITGNDPESLFLNSCFYADKSLGDFIKASKEKPWWKNTLVVITADHGHRHPGNKVINDKRRFRIPLLMIGGAIKYDTTIHTLGSQTDIANTVLAQIDRSNSDFIFSKNLMGNRVVPFAAYFFNDGYGFIMPDKYIVYDNPGKQFLNAEGATEDDLNLSKAYQQMLYSDYNKR